MPKELLQMAQQALLAAAVPQVEPQAEWTPLLAGMAPATHTGIRDDPPEINCWCAVAA